MRLFQATIAAFVVALFAGSANAAVIASANVGSFTTFQDTNTGRVWLGMNNFFGQTPNDMLAAANLAGFTLGTLADVHELLDPLPLNGGEWPSYKAIMGDAPNRELIWGFYDDGGDPYGWAYAYDSDTTWQFVDNIAPGGTIQNAGGEFADMNIWAYQSGQIVNAPEPITLSLFGTGLAGAVAMRRRKKKAA